MTTADEESEVQENVVSTLNRKILTSVVLVSLHNRRFMSQARRTRHFARNPAFALQVLLGWLNMLRGI